MPCHIHIVIVKNDLNSTLHITRTSQKGMLIENTLMKEGHMLVIATIAPSKYLCHCADTLYCVCVIRGRRILLRYSIWFETPHASVTCHYAARHISMGVTHLQVAVIAMTSCGRWGRLILCFVFCVEETSREIFRNNFSTPFFLIYCINYMLFLCHVLLYYLLLIIY